jgi:hypothetical protein
MSKNSFWFKHDYHSRSDKEMIKVRMKMGMAGVGLYWSIIEMLYEEGGYLQVSEYERITFELQSKYEDVTSLIEDYKLFIIDDEKFTSSRVLDQINARNIKSKTAKESISYRWKNTNVLRTNYERNTDKIKIRLDKDVCVAARVEKAATATTTHTGFDFLQYTKFLATDGKYLAALKKQFAWATDAVAQDEMHRFVLYLKKKNKSKWPKTEEQTKADFESFFINSKHNTLNAEK